MRKLHITGVALLATLLAPVSLANAGVIFHITGGSGGSGPQDVQFDILTDASQIGSIWQANTISGTETLGGVSSPITGFLGINGANQQLSTITLRPDAFGIGYGTASLGAFAIFDNSGQMTSFSTNFAGDFNTLGLMDLNTFNVVRQPNTDQQIPEPITFSFFVAGAAGAFALRRRQKKAA